MPFLMNHATVNDRFLLRYDQSQHQYYVSYFSLMPRHLPIASFHHQLAREDTLLYVNGQINPYAFLFDHGRPVIKSLNVSYLPAP